jgi:hypothetical protein
VAVLSLYDESLAVAVHPGLEPAAQGKRGPLPCRQLPELEDTERTDANTGLLAFASIAIDDRRYLARLPAALLRGVGIR